MDIILLKDDNKKKFKTHTKVLFIYCCYYYYLGVFGRPTPTFQEKREEKLEETRKVGGKIMNVDVKLKDDVDHSFHLVLPQCSEKKLQEVAKG